MTYGICVACQEFGEVQRHHLYPQQFFGRKKNQVCVALCQRCHREYHQFSDRPTRQPMKYYVNSFKDFVAKKQRLHRLRPIQLQFCE